jgi:hypothetical protein
VRPAARAALLAAAALLVLGCSTRFESFPFLTAEGTRIEIRASGRATSGKEARFQPSPARPSTPVYRLAAPFVVPAENQSFALSYTSDIRECALTIFSDRKTRLAATTLPASSGTRLRFLVPLHRGDRIWGYTITAAPGAARGSLELMGAGTVPFVHGFSIEKDVLSVDGSVGVLAASRGAVSARIPPATQEEMARSTWMISLGLQPESATARVVFTAGGKSAAFEISSRQSAARLDFARGSVDFLPRDVTVTGPLKSLQISTVPADEPLPADPGTILTWDRSAWRRPDFEVFSWGRFPRVLILDTASYDVQDGLFKRLAFFTEKAGHAGTIETPAALSEVHGYNAHDYRAEDLARFFSSAQRQGIALTTNERELARLLERNDVIRKADSGYTPGEGCIISISRSSSALLRELLLTHESFHGAFFSLPAFRDSVEKEWTSLSPVEQELWMVFLASRSYDTSDHFLVVNEFQSYLLQQRRNAVLGFQDVTVARIRAGSPRGAGLVARFLAAHPQSFLKAFDALDLALQSAGGPPGGEAISVQLAR